MPSIAAAVRAFVNGLSENVAFTTLHVLAALFGCGTRNAVDIELCRLVKNGVLKRLADGVFISNSRDSIQPGPLELAIIKAERFGKRILESRESDLRKDKDCFHTNGCKSAFESVHGRLQLKHLAPARCRNQAPSASEHVRVNQLADARNGAPGTANSSSEALCSDAKIEQEAWRMAFKLVRRIISEFENWQLGTESLSLSQTYLS